MNGLLDGARRRVRRAVGRVRRRLSGNDDGGFVLLESIIAISLITVIMAAIGVEYVSGLASVARQRATQTAAQVADSTLEQARALRPTDLVTGRGSASVATQFSKGNAIATISPWLQNMDQTSDASAPATAGAAATIPTCDPTPQGATGPAVCTQKPGTVAFTVAQFLGTCWLVSSGSSSNCVPAAQKTPTSVEYLRVVVSVGWKSGTCTAGCFYVTSTLINGDADPTFKANQPPPAAPAINDPANQVNDLGDTVSLQLSPVTGTGVPAFTWTLVSGTLPTGLTLSSSGLISGVVGGSTGTQSLTIQLTDGYGRQDTTTFTWTVYNGPQITAPPDQVTALNAAVNLAVTTTCQDTPCTYTLNNAPAGLSISNVGVITGAPTSAGTSQTSITVTDASNASATTQTFNWTVLASAPVCSSVQTVALANPSFEVPGVPAGAGNSAYNGTTGLGWRTTDATGRIEVWANGASSTSNNNNVSISAEDGSQWVELNGDGMDTLYQDIATTPGQVLQWSLWHRSRSWPGVTGQDSMRVQIGTTASQAPQVPTGATTSTISDGPQAWVHYTGIYTVPAGQTTTRFDATATGTSTGSSSVGNFLDNVTVAGAPCLTAAATAQTSTVNTPITPLQLTASQGSGSYTWSGGASLPAGLSLSSSGLITGTATATGAKQVALILTDASNGYQQSVTFTWTVTGSPTITTPSNQTSSVGATVSVAVSASCPNTPCSYSLSGAPAGLSINSTTGVIAGTPSTVGTANSVRVTVLDKSGASATTNAFTWVIKAAPTVNTPGNQATDVGVAVTVNVTSSCGYAPCTYSLNGAPSGLSIGNTNGVITGSPTTPGTSSPVSVTITDAAGVSATTSAFSWTIYSRPTITSPGNQASTVNTSLILPITSSCANSPCSYALSGAPAGLSINPATGAITGTPTATGTSASAKVTMTDAGGVQVNTGTFTWTVYARPTVTAPANQSTVNNAAVNLTLTKSCPDTPCAYALNGGPAGLSVTSAGVVTGTVTSPPQVFTGVTITVTDSAGATATSAAFNWTITAPLVGHWPFDESTGATAADTSGGGHTATLTGGYGRTGTAAMGANALTLNGTNSAATPSGTVLDTSASFTVSAWVKVNTTNGYQTFVSQDGTTVSAFYLQYRQDTGKFAFARYASDSGGSALAQANSVAAPVVGQWYQLTGVYDATAKTIALYVNGVPQGAPVAYTTGWNASGAAKFVIGRGKFSGSSTDWVNGAIDDVRAYSTALSDDAVAQLAQAGYWDLDDGAGTTADDSSLNNVDGTLSGGATWTSSSVVGTSAVQFNGSNGVITSNSTVLDTSQSFSVTAWAKADSAGATGTVASIDGTSVSGFGLVQSGGKWTLSRPASDNTNATITSVSATSNLTAGQWYQLAVVYDSVGKTLTLYVNGARQGNAVSFTPSVKVTGKFVIGRGKTGGAGAYYFGGAIDDVHAYQFALDQASITALTTQTPPAPAAPTATAGAGSATLTWTAPANVAGSPVTGYVVTPYLDGAAQSPITYNSTATTQTLTGLTSGGSYTFTVAAVNANGASGPSGQSAAVMPS